MPGPVPKPAAQRRRRNKVAGARTLQPVTEVAVAPRLPKRRVDGKWAKWRPETLEWWEDLWASPMAPEYDRSDIHGLFVLAVLLDDWWRDPSPERAKEFRLHRQEFGLSPISRRRLQWEIDRAEEAQDRTRRRRSPKATSEQPDPRAGAV